LKNKQNSIANHQVSKAIAAKIVKFAETKSDENVSNVLSLPLGNKNTLFDEKMVILSNIDE
jgi:hypothetical protein